MKLYEIAAELQAVLYAANEHAEANMGVIPEAIADDIDDLEMALDDKISNIVRLVKNLTSEAEAIKAEEKRLSERRKSKEGQVEGLKIYLSKHAQGYTHEDAYGRLSWRKSERCVVDDQTKIPNDYIAMEPKIDVSKIKVAIKAGNTVPGAHVETINNPQIK